MIANILAEMANTLAIPTNLLAIILPTYWLQSNILAIITFMTYVDLPPC